MKKQPLLLSVTLLLGCLLFTSCTAKLTTIRPSSISKLHVERIADGAEATLPCAEHNADVMERLVLQLEEPYGAAGDCSETDGHIYHATLMRGENGQDVELEVFINEDSSVCKDGRRYVPLDKADSPVNIGDWNALFAEERPDTSEPDTSTPEPQQPTKPGNMEIVASKGEAKPMPAGSEVIDSVPVADVSAWSYYISNVRYDGQDFVMVWRDTLRGDAEWICSIPQTTGDTALRHSVEYVEESCGRSGEKYLYFTITDAATFHRSLWCFDVENVYFNRVLDAPCSNMIILADAPQDLKNIGWIVCDKTLAALDLQKGTADQSASIDLTEYIEGSLFYEIGDFGTHKFVALSDKGSHAVQIEVITAEPETSAPEQRQSYQIDLN